MKAKTAREELVAVLKNANNTHLPAISIPAMTEFKRLNQPFKVLQRRVQNNEDIFAEPPPDFKQAAANDV